MTVSRDLPANLADGRVAGVRHVFGAYFLYAVGDAAAKWLVGSLSVWEVLFVRSWLGLLILLVIGGRRAIDAVRQLPGKHELLGMTLANFCGWALYYSAAVSLPLPQLYTAYYLSPIFAALLAGPMLGERIQISSWIAGGLGFLGVLITIAPTHSPLPAMLPALLGLGAALMWALSSVLYRRNVHHGTGLVIVVFSNVVIGALSAPLAWHWQHIDAYKALILLVVAVAGLAAHFLYISGMRRVSVAVAGPVGFFSLIWSVLLAYLIWGEVPRAGFLAGAGLIVLAGLIVFGGEWRRTRSAVRAARLS